MGNFRRTIGIGSATALLGATLALVGGVAFGAAAAGAATSFTFTGGGYGHGVGMSQWGAKGRADQGQSAGDILAAYYPGTAIVGTRPSGPRVKLGDTPSTTLVQPGGTMAFAPDGGAVTGLAAAGDTVNLWADGTRIVGQRTAPTADAPFVVAEAGRMGVIGFGQGRR